MKIQTPETPLNTAELGTEEQNALRSRDVHGLIDGVIGRYSEFFAEPANRLEFINHQSAEEFLMLVRFVNSKVRGERFYQMQQNPEETTGGSLPALHTPNSEDKLAAFEAGFSAIKEYINENDDTSEEKVKAVALATEALIIWVHPFNDGNGRTSRFIGNLIEDGGSDPEELARQTVSSGARGTIYQVKYKSKEQALEEISDYDLLISDQEREEQMQNLDKLPNDIEATYWSVRNLLEDTTLQYAITSKAQYYRNLNRPK